MGTQTGMFHQRLRLEADSVTRQLVRVAERRGHLDRDADTISRAQLAERMERLLASGRGRPCDGWPTPRWSRR